MSSSKDFLYGERQSGGQHGDVFTSPAVVNFILDSVNYSADRNLAHVRILEPSCGDGEFVVEIARRLLLSAITFGFDASEAFQQNVRAYDIDSNKTARCRQRIGELGINQCDENIQTADFLKAEVEDTDIVVGNPPYIRYENIPAEMLDYCKRTFPTFHYRCDLYVPFFEKSLNALSPGGLHCFICSNRWLKNKYGKKLRRMVARYYQLRTIINLEQANAFQEEVLAYPAITIISSDFPAFTFQYAEYASVEELNSHKTEEKRMPREDDWTEAFSKVSADSRFLTIEQQGFKIGIGVATGADSVFISPDLPAKVEADLIMPGINARDLRGDKFQWQGEYLLNPYNADGTLVNLEKYPRASAYLEEHRERLTSRHIAKKSPSRWYKTIDRISPALLSKPKILLPDMSGNTYVFVDDGNYYPLHNIYYIIGSSSVQLRLLAAFLMSDFVRNQLSSVTNKMNGGYLRWQSQHLRKLKIPKLSSIPADDVQQLLSYYENNEISSLNNSIKRYI
ncbi:MAG: Eco57I restriction-modification methylase domain-containing protein [Paludibacteraceae bacterium]|nr:Eco57I restriction-modification methylase domain-containing protein [Paludibacteraceae bacterium]